MVRWKASRNVRLVQIDIAEGAKLSTLFFSTSGADRRSLCSTSRLIPIIFNRFETMMWIPWFRRCAD